MDLCGGWQVTAIPRTDRSGLPVGYALRGQLREPGHKSLCRIGAPDPFALPKLHPLDGQDAGIHATTEHREDVQLQRTQGASGGAETGQKGLASGILWT